MTEISANLLLKAKGRAAGQSQAELVQELIDLGFTTIEVRREYFESITEEMPGIAALRKKHNLTLYYSVPDEVFVAGALNPLLQQYLDEAKIMGISKIKWNTGDFAHFTGNLKETLTPIVSQGIEVNIENDQTQTSGTLAPVKAFLEAVKAEAIDLGYVYDLGNWPFVGGEPMLSARELTTYVRYIHIKDDIIKGEKPVTVPLDGGDLHWREILDVLPKDVPIALEYPTESDDVLLEGLQKLQDYLEKR